MINRVKKIESGSILSFFEVQNTTFLVLKIITNCTGLIGKAFAEFSDTIIN